MLLNRFITLTALLLFSACKEQKPPAPTAPQPPQQTGPRFVTLTNQELQDALGILAWKFIAPREEGKDPGVLFEQYTDGERVSIMENGIPASVTSKETLVILRKDGDFIHYDIKTGGSRGSGSWPTMPFPLKGNTPPSYQTIKEPTVTQNSTILMRIKYWEAIESLNGRSMRYDASTKPNTEIVLRVSSDTEPLLYASKGELKR